MSDSKYKNGSPGMDNYQRDLNESERARNSQKRDTDPMIEKEGFLGMDDIDKMRRKNIDKWYWI